MIKKTFLIFFFLLLAKDICAQYQISASVFGNGGGSLANSTYQISSTVGQTQCGEMQGGNYCHNIGFWSSFQILTSVENVEEMFGRIPIEYALCENYPNPFNPITTLQYGLPEASDVNLMIFDISGRKVKAWSIGNQQPGWHEVVWNGTDQRGCMVSTGVYIYCLRAGSFVDTKKMVFMK